MVLNSIEAVMGTYSYAMGYRIGHFRMHFPKPKERSSLLAARRNAKMARSAHAYMRGNTVKFYEWLESAAGKSLPDGPPVWICGDCHVGNLGPLANVKGHVDIQIRDLDQTVIGNPTHDLIRLGLSLATAVRSSNLPGVTTAHMIEHMVQGYENALTGEDGNARTPHATKGIQRVMHQALKRRWKHLAQERIADVRPTIPLGDKFWPIGKSEKQDLKALLDTQALSDLVTALHSRKNNAELKLLDAAYWIKGCSSLGRLRYAALIGVGMSQGEEGDICFLDIKEATTAVAPRAKDAKMPKDNAVRVVEGARCLSPNLGQRMLAAQMSERSVVIRELLPQDLKLEVDQLTQAEAIASARYLAGIVGQAHARQMDDSIRRSWIKLLSDRRSKNLDAPSWLWSSIVELIGIHEAAYLEHCRRHLAEAA
jgi:uncharacterized protein (DUF2252 family)